MLCFLAWKGSGEKFVKQKEIQVINLQHLRVKFLPIYLRNLRLEKFLLRRANLGIRRFGVGDATDIYKVGTFETVCRGKVLGVSRSFLTGCLIGH